MLADELAQALDSQGAAVVGPAPDIARALALLDAGAMPDGAILDVNLGGDPVFRLADALLDRGIPFVFTTGYDVSVFPSRFAHVSKCEKPFNIRRIAAALGEAINR